MKRWRWHWTRILFVLVISQVVQMYFSTDVMAQLNADASASREVNAATNKLTFRVSAVVI